MALGGGRFLMSEVPLFACFLKNNAMINLKNVAPSVVSGTLDETHQHRNVKRFRGGLVFKAHRLSDHSTLGLRVIKKRRSYSHLQRLRVARSFLRVHVYISFHGAVRDWYFIAEQPAPAPHFARPEGRAALTHMC